MIYAIHTQLNCYTNGVDIKTVSALLGDSLPTVIKNIRSIFQMICELKAADKVANYFWMIYFCRFFAVDI